MEAAARDRSMLKAGDTIQTIIQDGIPSILRQVLHMRWVAQDKPQTFVKVDSELFRVIVKAFKYFQDKVDHDLNSFDLNLTYAGFQGQVYCGRESC